jgi:glucose/arabinose dehydrogenase
MRLRTLRLALLLVLLAATPAHAIELEPFLEGFNSPVYLTHSRDGSGRLFVVEQGGLIHVVAAGSSSRSVFLDIASKVVAGGERGLLGLAFHPLFALNGRFFVHYTRAGDGAIVIAEYQRSANPDQASAASERILLVVPHPMFANHNGGMVEFGPDGFLYIALGDGGSAFDPFNNAQNPNALLGKILRIDVDSSTGSLPYGIPASNPFAFGGGAPEIWALGLRNPFRFSFDRGTGLLLAGDVGQAQLEEIDIIVGGGNYGWNALEGTRCTGRGNTPCVPERFVPPLVEYLQESERCSVTGGYVYQGPSRATQPGTYLFGDFCTGEIFTASDGVAARLLDSPLLISSFGEDAAGEIYVVSLDGQVQRIVASPLDRFVSGLYTHLLGRDGGATELAFWTGVLGSACSTSGFSTVVGGFLDSEELRFFRPLPLTEQVSVLYRSVLGREPDAGGLQGWVDVLRQMRRAIALVGIMQSPEFQGVRPAPSNRPAVEAFVRRLYLELLGREPGAALSPQVDFIVRTGNLDAVVANLLGSAEFESRPLTQRDFVRAIYRALLAREPDPTGLNGFELVMRGTLLGIGQVGFVGSAEFQSKIPALCP